MGEGPTMTFEQLVAFQNRKKQKKPIEGRGRGKNTPKGLAREEMAGHPEEKRRPTVGTTLPLRITARI